MAGRVRGVGIELERAAPRRRVLIDLREPTSARVLELEVLVAVVNELVAAHIRLANSIGRAGAGVHRETAAVVEVVREQAVAASDIRIEVRALLDDRCQGVEKGTD